MLIALGKRKGTVLYDKHVTLETELGDRKDCRALVQLGGGVRSRVSKLGQVVPNAVSRCYYTYHHHRAGNTKVQIVDKGETRRSLQNFLYTFKHSRHHRPLYHSLKPNANIVTAVYCPP